jgi:hypothetical protein
LAICNAVIVFPLPAGPTRPSRSFNCFFVAALKAMSLSFPVGKINPDKRTMRSAIGQYSACRGSGWLCDLQFSWFCDYNLFRVVCQVGFYQFPQPVMLEFDAVDMIGIP